MHAIIAGEMQEREIETNKESATVFNIEEELKKLPAQPGVYLMHDAADAIIYVGKAVILKNRVRQYFQKSRKPSQKIEQMVSHIRWFEYIVTDSEMEALVLESNLIKEHRPRYNTMLMDDKAYPYIKVTLNEPYPRVLLTRRQTRDGARYFGPYPDGLAVRDTLELLHKLYMVRNCSRVLPRDIGKERPCLNAHIGQCTAPCEGKVTQEEYREQIEGVISLLSGNYREKYRELTAKMKEAAAELEFEEAARYRDLAESVKSIAAEQKITDSRSDNDRDIIACAAEGGDGVVQVFFVREGKLIGRDHYHVAVGDGDGEAEILSSFIKQYYAGTPFLPAEIFVPCPLEDMDALSQWLSSKREALRSSGIAGESESGASAPRRKVTFLVPKRGTKERLLELAAQNAKIVLDRDRDRIRREEQRTTGALAEIEEWLGITGIRRIEAYDISNTSGLESVGSMVVYEDGKPKRNDYRKFRIKTVQGPNDYASMKEVLGRRFSRALQGLASMDDKDGAEGADASQPDSFTHLPDIIMMDGGRGQVNMALEVLAELSLDIPVCGMVKDDHHRTRGLYFNNVELPIDTHSEGFHLITRIQDEAHRFAITYHKSLRGKKEIHSILDDIPGVGEKRRLALMKAYGDLSLIRDASVDELVKIPLIDEKTAKSIVSFFHPSDTDTSAGELQEGITAE